MAQREMKGREAVRAKRLPTLDPAAFAPGDEITIGRTRYIVQQNQYGEHRVMVSNPNYSPGGDSPRFLYFTYDEIRERMSGDAQARNPE